MKYQVLVLFVFVFPWHLAMDITRCDTIYEISCPAGWIPGMTHCNAPLSYAGPCATATPLFSADLETKKRFESHCQVKWPCQERCAGAFANCPKDWLDMGGGVCEAPLLFFQQGCPTRMYLPDEVAKQQLVAQCDVTFACPEQCSQDLERPCPIGWISVNGICTAPHQYTGPCLPFANLQGLSTKDKLEFRDRCDVHFPCHDSSQVSQADTCEPVGTQLCPNGWGHFGNIVEYCHRSDYIGPCRPLISAAQLLSIGKVRFTKMCNVSWPCQPRSTHSFSSGSSGGGDDVLARNGPLLTIGKSV